MAKSRDAFRTISEVSAALDTPTHVLRFWESKFTQIKPVKRAGGRRYYRPEDISLLAGIKVLLHDQGMTIKGAQKLLRESGAKNVMALGDAQDGTAHETETSKPIVDTAHAKAETGNPAIGTTVPSPEDRLEQRPALATTVAPTTARTARPALLPTLAQFNKNHVGQLSRQIRPLLKRLEKLSDEMRAA